MGVRPVRIAFVAMSLIASLLAGGAGFDATPSPDHADQSTRVVPGEIIVGLVDGADVASVARGVGATSVEPLHGGNAFVLSVSGDPFGVAAQARGLSGVRYAEPNYVRTLHATAPNDTDFGLKWDLHNDGTLSDGSDQAASDADIDFLEAYGALETNTFSTTIVAILDTGIDASHPDLNDKLVTGYDAFDGDNNPADGFGHGTHVAGIAAAETNNATGTAGVGFPSAVKIMPVKVCDDNGSCPTSAIVAGVNFAVANDAKVINMSFGSSVRSQAEEDAFDAAHAAGAFLVASAGNSNVDTPNYPAAYEPAVMAIAATGWADGKASYSNYDATWVDLAAPGGDMDKYDDPEGIYSTMPTYNVYLTSCRARGLLSPCYDQNYDQLAGTSMAAPQVAGAAGLLFAINSSLSNTDVRSIIETTADGVDGTGTLWANGRLNLYDAVLAVTNGTIDAAPTVSIASPSDGASFSSGESISFTGSASDTEDGDLTANLVWTSDLDGQIGTGGSFSAVLNDGTHVITASVTDSGGNTGTGSITITVVNETPTVSIASPSDGASFSSGESISFTGSASDTEDGDLTANLVWTSDLDGQIGTGGSFSAVLNDGTHVITASVTDSGGNTGTDTITITVGSSAISLSLDTYKVRGTQHADLSWHGATSTQVDIYRDGSLVATTANDGEYTDNTGQRGGGSSTYQVCEAGTSTCSDEVTANW